MKKNLDALTKAKLIYSGELIVIAIIFIVIAILKFEDMIFFFIYLNFILKILRSDI